MRTDQDENPERKYKMYLENCILRYELHEMIEDHEMQRHQTKFPNTNTNDREIERSCVVTLHNESRP